ncbi:MAG: sugar transferase [Bacteroidetes bacterium]|jgi:lipopolysaccharide/colanic/teichoic acid biosynthesis glycosyltransferase|nr:sugar transferase [Bacteroidota bacterium]
MFLKNIRKNIYRPSVISIVIDLMILLLALIVVLNWFPLTTRNPYGKYDEAALVYAVLWVLFSYLLGRYKPLHFQTYLPASFKLLYIIVLNTFLLSYVSYAFFNSYYSQYVIFTYSTVLFVINISFISLYFALLYAVDYDEEIETADEVRENAVVVPAPRLSDDELKERYKMIAHFAGNTSLVMLKKSIDLGSGNTFVHLTSDYQDIESVENYAYDTIIHLPRLNSHRGINKLFRIVNQKLPDKGFLVCCFESKSTRKKKILNRYPSGINYIFYLVNYTFRRLLPKIFITRRLYYDITKGKRRILSKTEVLGRLYYSGFEVIKEKKIGDLNYFYARRKKQPESQLKRNYGPLIRLRRTGKHGEIFDVYKMRTMHPYSEYIQAYIYERNKLDDGGKFKRDIRVTTLGRLMRKYWLDELPMIFNLLKGDMKVVGVRPLSVQYFNLYDKELQEKRVKFKPGLLPPFYVDMPKSIEEIQASEMKYLTECENKGVFRTDIKYFFLILKNIFFNRARSA